MGFDRRLDLAAVPLHAVGDAFQTVGLGGQALAHVAGLVFGPVRGGIEEVRRLPERIRQIAQIGDRHVARLGQAVSLIAQHIGDAPDAQIVFLHRNGQQIHLPSQQLCMDPHVFGPADVKGEDPEQNQRKNQTRDDRADFMG